MVILEAILQNFGKFHNTTVGFEDGINLIYGENETGKSTLHTFLQGMLFGIEKARGRSSGIDTYTLYEPWENSSYYEGILRLEKDGVIYRIHRCFYKSDKSITVLNETTGEEMGEQGLSYILEGVTERSFINTVCIGQLRAATDQTLAELLQNTVANLYTSGNMEWDIPKAFRFLKAEKKQVIKKRNAKAEEKEKNYQIQQEYEQLEKDIAYQNALKEEKQSEMSNIKENIKGTEKKQKKEVQAVILMLSLGLILVCISIASVFLKYHLAVPISLGVFAFLFFCIALYNRSKMKKDSLLLKEQLDKKKQLEDEQQKLDWKLEQMQEKSAAFQADLEAYQIEEEKKYKMQEEIEALALAEETLSEVCKTMQKDFKRNLNQKISGLVSYLTDGKYTKVAIDSACNIFILTPTQKLSIQQLSRGTMEQIYLALRLAAANCIPGYEKMPLILDDAFALYDEKRLEKILCYFAQEEQRQILIFTCHKREEDILIKNNIPHRKIVIKSIA